MHIPAHSVPFNRVNDADKSTLMASSMNIAFVSDFCTPYTTGGVERRYYELSQYLISKGHKVTWFTSRQWEGASEVLIDGIRIRSISGRFQTYRGNRYSGNR